MACRCPGEMLQTVFAFGTKAGAVRAGKFDHDLPSRTVAGHDSRQGRSDAEQEMKGDGRKAENRALQAWPPAGFHGAMIALGRKRVKKPAKKSGPFRGKARVMWTGNYLDPPRRSAIRIFLASRSVPIDRSNPAWETL